jgi:hypothetical protein
MEKATVLVMEKEMELVMVLDNFEWEKPEYLPRIEKGNGMGFGEGFKKADIFFSINGIGTGDGSSDSGNGNGTGTGYGFNWPGEL